MSLATFGWVMIFLIAISALVVAIYAQVTKETKQDEVTSTPVVEPRTVHLTVANSPYINLDVSDVDTMTCMNTGGVVTIESLSGGVDGQKIDLFLFGDTSGLVVEVVTASTTQQGLTGYGEITTNHPPANSSVGRGTFYFNGSLNTWIYYDTLLSGGP